MLFTVLQWAACRSGKEDLGPEVLCSTCITLGKHDRSAAGQSFLYSCELTYCVTPHLNILYSAVGMYNRVYDMLIIQQGGANQT